MAALATPEQPLLAQLRERAQQAGVTLEPQIEVEYVTAALDLAARGLGDTICSRSIVIGRGYGKKLGSVSFAPPFYETFAFIRRRNAHLSPGTREFIRLAERRCRAG